MTRVRTLTSKGQVTIPKEIRDELGLKPRDKVEIYLEDGDAWLRKVDPSSEEVTERIPVEVNRETSDHGDGQGTGNDPESHPG